MVLAILSSISVHMRLLQRENERSRGSAYDRSYRPIMIVRTTVATEIVVRAAVWESVAALVLHCADPCAELEDEIQRQEKIC